MIRRIAALSTSQQILLALLAAALVGAVGVAAPRLGDVALLVASGALLAVLAVLGQWLWQHQHATDWSNSFEDASAARGGDVRISRLAESISAAGEGRAPAVEQVHTVLTGLAAERLRDRRGIDARSDPAAAQAAWGPDLTAYLTGPPTGRVSPDRLDRLITTLEEL
jgi:hypothetical protein